QIIRVTDVNTNGAANDAGEAAIVYSTTESGISPNDLVSLPNGDLLFADLTGKKVYRLSDANADGSFGTGASSERSIFWNNGLTLAADVRFVAILPSWTGAGTGDMNSDGLVNADDVPGFVQELLDPTSLKADYNWDGSVDGCDI